MNDHHDEFIENKRTHQPISSSSSNITIIDDPFSSLSLLDPSHEISQSSKEAGRIAGRTASFNEGRSIGRTKGWEVGLELGYVFNFCMELLDGLKLQQQQQQQRNEEQSSNNIDNGDDDDDDGTTSGNNMQQSAQNKKSTTSSNRTTSRLDRCTTLARDIITLIEDFPPPQNLLHNLDDDDIDDDVATGNNHHQQLDAKLDISTSIQRIRAKFKLLSVLLKTGQSFDLKRILELKGESTEEGNHDKNGVVDVDANVVVKAVELQKDDDGGVVVRSRHKYDVEHKSNAGDDW